MYDKHLTIICWLVPKALGIGNIYSTEQEQHKFVEATKEEDASRFYINVTGCVVWCGVVWRGIPIGNPINKKVPKTYDRQDFCQSLHLLNFQIRYTVFRLIQF